MIVYAQPYGEGSPRAVATILTGVNGAWQYLARPRIATTYQASWRSRLSTPVTIAVRPRITFTRLKSGRFVSRVLAGHSFAGRLVQLQRWNGVRWVTLRRARLGAALPDRVQGDAAQGTLDAAHRVQRQPGRRGLPRCDEPGAQSDRQALIGDQRSIIRWFASL